MPPYPPSTDPPATVHRAAISRQALSISLAVIPFGLAFGVLCARAGLHPLEALCFSALVFTGSAQFAAVTVLSNGGTVAAAVAAGVLLNLRCLAFGVVMAPSLRGPLWWRALVSQLLIDESTAVGSAQARPAARRYGYLAAGIGVFLTWNASTLVGVLAGSGGDGLITDAGIDATIPAAFLALVWPRLSGAGFASGAGAEAGSGSVGESGVGLRRWVAAAGAVVAVVTTPLLPAGLPILAAAPTALAARPWRKP